jgi:hypothetical protein
MPIKDKYVPLGAHLRRVAGDHSDLSLTFAEIERIIGGTLPQGARSAPFWEGVNGRPPPRARAWLSAGFVAQPDLARERVRFHRQAQPGQRPGGRR